jgi:hypothetical protein
VNHAQLQVVVAARDEANAAAAELRAVANEIGADDAKTLVDDAERLEGALRDVAEIRGVGETVAPPPTRRRQPPAARLRALGVALEATYDRLHTLYSELDAAGDRDVHNLVNLDGAVFRPTQTIPPIIERLRHS